MADATRGNRPLSPHISIYRVQMTSTLSILHRLTGVALTLGAILVVWWFLAAASSAAYFNFVDGLLNSWFGGLVMIGSLWAFWYHFCTGIRHLIWDTGHGLELADIRISALAVIAGSVILTVVTLIAAF